MRGYRKVKIDENKQQKPQEEIIVNYNFIEKNLVKIAIIIVVLIAFFLFIGFYLINKGQKEKNNIRYNKTSNNTEINKKLNLNNSNVNNNNESINYQNNTNEINITKNIENDRNKTYEEVLKYYNSLRVITKEEVAEFRRVNNLGILYDRTKYKRTENPDITVVTTIYNQAHCIKKAIRSVQNQSLKNIEMIIVDDCSLDNSTETVEQFMKEDERIILLKHEDNNEGVMITRNEGIRKAKGKYIVILDPDDTLAHKDILNFTFHIATMANLDVVEFYTSLYYDNVFQGYYHLHGDFPILYQPELKYKFIGFNEEDLKNRPIKCRTVWGKIVKNEIFQKTLDNIPSKYLYDYILGFEDTMITISLYQVANSYYCLKQPGYYYTFDERRNRYPLTKTKKCKIKEGVIKEIDHIKYLQFLLDKIEDNELGKQIIFYELRAINNYTYSNFKRTIKHHFNWTYSIFDELLNSKYLKIKQKEEVLKIKEEIKENENELRKKNVSIIF